MRWLRSIRARRDWSGFWDGFVSEFPDSQMTVAQFQAWWTEHHWHMIDAPESLDVEPGDVITFHYRRCGTEWPVLIVDGDDAPALSADVPAEVTV